MSRPKKLVLIGLDAMIPEFVQKKYSLLTKKGE